MANWIGTITNEGNSLLNAWVAGKSLNFDKAMAGTGTVAEVALMAQTSLTDPKQMVGIVGAERVNTGYRLKLQVQAADEEYTLNQIGVWAALTGEGSVMLALFQTGLNSKGIPIPSKAETPDFLYTFYALVMCSNTGSWTVTPDPTAFLPRGELDKAIEKHNADPAAHAAQRRVIASRIRDPSKPTYGLGGGGEDGGERSVVLEAGPYTGTTEASVVVSGVLYDALNMSTHGDTSPDGTIIVTEE